ncbi:LysE family translocator [Guptibacillus hwajinpoensis]|uniref:Threonine transporter RhtB n=1 Tax=Guptibacillus hwajinpoensis TaxID=208199 RepID=A0A0J6FUM2_9BACL|nr:LysE family translocator [Alkalihalobacillus macyae]KMM38057.1 threonine transporter RhtB [Alkalihalobacillus macyae]
MEMSLLLSFFGAAVLLTLMPGPDNLFVLAQSISQNKQAGIATSLGLCSGLLVHITAAAVGISALLYQSSLAFSIVKYLGAAYLLYMAYQAFRERGATSTINNQQSRSYSSLYRKGIVMNILNPKVSLFFLALLPQFIDQNAGYPALQMVLLGGIFIIQALLIFSGISLFAGKLSTIVSRNEKASRRINLLKGTLLAVIGIQIAFSEK